MQGFPRPGGVPPVIDTPGAMTMTRETTERCLAKRTAHAMRTAAIRLAQERAAEDPDPSLAYGCVDWFRYGARPLLPQGVDPVPSSAAVRPGNGRGCTSSTH